MFKCGCLPQRKSHRLIHLEDEAKKERTCSYMSLPDWDQMDGSKLNTRPAIRAPSINLGVNYNLLKYPKDSNDKEVIREAIQKNDLLSNILKGERLQSVIEAMYRRDVEENEVIIQEGDYGEHLYVSASGSYEVLIDKITVNTFNDRKVFGELAILYNARRNASIKCVQSGRLWVLDRVAFKIIVIKRNIDEQEEICSFLKKVPKLNAVGEETLYHVAKLMNKEYFTANTIIIQQGTHGDKFYIIRNGTVTISKENEGVVGTYTKGQYFGELALLNENYQRQATVTANPPEVECFTLNRVHFIKHFGNIDLHQIQIYQKPKNIEIQNDKYADIFLCDLQQKIILGEGAFGCVLLAVHKTQNYIFALKRIKKAEMIKKQHIKYIFQEKQIQMSCTSPFIIQLYKTFQDNKYLYFLMEPCLGGDLFSLLYRLPNKYFDETAARFIAASVLEALIYLHQKNIIYRDLKPENILLDQDGYIKLADFGLAKLMDAYGKTYTYIGTPEYMAPEIILERGYDKAIDCWAFGIFIFELLAGKTPFSNPNRSEVQIFNSIIKGIDNVVFPEHIQNTAKHLIKNLCRMNPIERLGCTKNGLLDIKNHKWFFNFDFMKLRQRKLPVPYPPKLKINTDTNHCHNVPKNTNTLKDATDCFVDF